MKFQNILTALALAAVTGAAFSSAALADRGPMGDMPGMEMGMGGPGPHFDFATVDADKDGKVTEAELTACRPRGRDDHPRHRNGDADGGQSGH